MKKIFFKAPLLLVVSVVLVGCATGKMGRSEKSDKVEKVKQSKVCRGKVDRQSGFEQFAAIVQADPVAFACRSTHYYARALAKSYAALGRAEEEKRALRFVENLENGTGDPTGLNTLAATDVSTDQKAREAEELAGGRASDRLQLLREAQIERNKAVKILVGGGGAALASGIVQIRAAAKTDDALTKVAAALKLAQMLQVIKVLPAIADTNARINDNFAHLDAIINVPKEDASALKQIKPD